MFERDMEYGWKENGRLKKMDCREVFLESVQQDETGLLLFLSLMYLYSCVDVLLA